MPLENLAIRSTTPLENIDPTSHEYTNIQLDRKFAENFGQLPDPTYSQLYSDRAGMPTKSQEQYAITHQDTPPSSRNTIQDLYTSHSEPGSSRQYAYEQPQVPRSHEQPQPRLDNHQQQLYHTDAGPSSTEDTPYQRALQIATRHTKGSVRSEVGEHTKKKMDKNDHLIALGYDAMRASKHKGLLDNIDPDVHNLMKEKYNNYVKIKNAYSRSKWK